MRYLFVLAIILTFVGFASAQEQQDLTISPKISAPEKIDEFGDLSDCDLSGRLDNFFIKLHHNPELTGYILTYVGNDVLPSRRNFEFRERLYGNYIVFRKFDASRIVFIKGGYRQNTLTELWLVPPGFPSPKPGSTIDPPKLPTDKTYLYDYTGSEIFYYQTDVFLLQSEIDKRKREEPSDNLRDEQIAELTRDFEDNFDWLDTGFISTIKGNKSLRGVIVFYLDDEIFDKNKIRKYLESAVNRIAAAAKMNTDKFKIVFGGYRGGMDFEMWVMPVKGKLPELKPQERYKETATIDN